MFSPNSQICLVNPLTDRETKTVLNGFIGIVNDLNLSLMPTGLLLDQEKKIKIISCNSGYQNEILIYLTHKNVKSLSEKSTNKLQLMIASLLLVIQIS